MTWDSIEYLCEKFGAGVSSLDDWPDEPPRGRLENAYLSQVMRGDRPGPELPAELRDRIARFHERMRLIPDPTEGEFGTIGATIAAMTTDEAADMMTELRAIEAELRRLRDSS